MWEQTLETTTDISAKGLWAIVADLKSWSLWHPGVEGVRQSSDSVYVQKDGSWIRLAVEESNEPTRFVVSHSLLFARVRTAFQFSQRGRATGVRISVDLTGPGALLARYAVHEQSMEHLSTLIHCLVERAREVFEPEFEPALDFEEHG